MANPLPPMALKYDKLFALFKEKGYTSYHIRKEKIVGNATYTKLKDGTGIIDSRTIATCVTFWTVSPVTLWSL